VAKVLVSDVMATHHDRRTAWPDRQSRQRPRAVRITSHRAVLPPCLRQRPILAEYRINRKSVLDGLTDEHHIAACPPRTATERRRPAPESYFRAPTGLAPPCGPAEGPFAEYPMAALVLHINREALHHGAEIALLRDLYANR
jgi:hypothetical protein